MLYRISCQFPVHCEHGLRNDFEFLYLTKNYTVVTSYLNFLLNSFNGYFKRTERTRKRNIKNYCILVTQPYHANSWKDSTLYKIIVTKFPLESIK